MPVTALVSEDTRRMAHNLDDLYSRWVARHSKTHLEAHFLIPKMWHGRVDTLQEAITRLESIKQMRNETEAALMGMKGGEQWTREDHQQRALLVAEQSYLNTSINWLKQEIVRLRQANFTNARNPQFYPVVFSAWCEIIRVLNAESWIVGTEERVLIDTISDYLEGFDQFAQDKAERTK